MRTDTQDTLVMETPPRRILRKKSSGNFSSEVKHALRRPQTVDMENTHERITRAKEMQKKLSEEFEAAKQATKDEPAEDEVTEKPAKKSKSEAKPKLIVLPSPANSRKKNKAGQGEGEERSRRRQVRHERS